MLSIWNIWPKGPPQNDAIPFILAELIIVKWSAVNAPPEYPETVHELESAPNAGNIYDGSYSTGDQKLNYNVHITKSAPKHGPMQQYLPI